LKEKRELSGSRSPPRVIVSESCFFFFLSESDWILILFIFCSSQVLFALCASVDLESVADDLLSLLSKDTCAVLPGTVASSEYKTRITVYLIAVFFFF